MTSSFRRASANRTCASISFEALVHQRGAVDGDFRAHRPVGMGDRLLRRRDRHALARPFAERAAGGRQRHPLERVRLREVEKLEGRVVFGIDGNDASRADAVERVAEEIARGDDAFLVGERDGGAAPGPRQASVRAPAAPTIATMTTSLGAAAASVMAACPAAVSMPSPANASFSCDVRRVSADHGKARPESARLFGQQIRHSTARSGLRWAKRRVP